MCGNAGLATFTAARLQDLLNEAEARGRKAALEEAILVVMSFCQACETGRGSANSTAHKIRQAIEQMPLGTELAKKETV